MIQKPVRSAVPSRGTAFRREGAAAVGALLIVASAGALSGCYAPGSMNLRSALDSLRAVVDTMAIRDSVTLVLMQETRREVAEQRDVLLSTRATTGSTTQELFEQMSRLEGKLDEVSDRFQQVSSRRPAESTPSGAEAQQLYDQAQQDLTQGRYDLALQGFREFVRRYPSLELSDNALYGAAECLFAQSQFDSAMIEYARLESLYPKSEKLPSAMYKLGLSQEKMERTAEAKRTFEELVRRYPNSGEAQLARERLGTARRR